MPSKTDSLPASPAAPLPDSPLPGSQVGVIFNPVSGPRRGRQREITFTVSTVKPVTENDRRGLEVKNYNFKHGLNLVSQDAYTALSKTFSAHFSDGSLEMIPDVRKLKMGTDGNAVSIAEVGEAEAIKIVAVQSSEEVLRRWAATDTRPKVAQSISLRLREVTRLNQTGAAGVGFMDM